MAAPRLNARIAGKGPDLVLLHSLLSDRGSFDPLVERLAERRRLIAVDLPGFGNSPPADCTIAAFAEAVGGALEDLAVAPGADLLGNGLGSFVGLALARRRPEALGRLVLLGGAVAFPEAGRETFRKLAETVEREGMEAVVAAALGRMFPADFIAANPRIVAERTSVLVAMDPSVFAGACRALAAMDLGPELPKIVHPVLIVVGERDGATTPPLARDLAGRLAHAELIELSGLGHAPHLQDPDRLVTAITPFLGLSG